MAQGHPVSFIAEKGVELAFPWSQVSTLTTTSHWHSLWLCLDTALGEVQLRINIHDFNHRRVGLASAETVTAPVLNLLEMELPVYDIWKQTNKKVQLTRH